MLQLTDKIWNNLIYLWFFINLMLIASYSYGQQLSYAPGEILVEVKSALAINRLIKSNQHFENKTTALKSGGKLATPFPYYKLLFDDSTIHAYRFLEKIRQHPDVINAQLNHFVSSRLEPDDPLFSSQWYHFNDGSSGGVVGADLDSKLAWDFSTGGLTPQGDTIVICIVDEGLETGHEDLAGNIWVNHAEIPDNGNDDDGNGYIDDYLGWNVISTNDQIDLNDAANGHGTPLAGIIGAIGNNNTGITGITWNTKMMMVIRGETEDKILEAYAYPYQLRKKYNQTAGAQGAFVVAVNTSWGINFGQPEDAPLWCAFYDSLGMEGILCPAATINSDQNVDVVGDLPTTCSSDFLITLTSINNSDQKVTSTGYGAVSIDLAAYGKSIVSTSINNEYLFFDGTSMTAPQVAGTIGLLYSQCPDLSALAKSNPAAAAIKTKQLLINGGEVNSSLVGITVTGKQLNIFNSIQAVVDSCENAGCYGPYAVSWESIDTSTILISWINDEFADKTNIRYRIKNTAEWSTLTHVETPFQLTNLTPCTVYEFQLQTDCNNVIGPFNPAYEFVTPGCCHPPENIEINYIDSSATIQWEEINFTPSYTLAYRETGTQNWVSSTVSFNSLIIENLLPCTSYDVIIRSNCISGQISDWSIIQSFITQGCDVCQELNYCSASGPTTNNNTWISRVQVGTINNQTANENNGYSYFPEISTSVIQGYFHEILIETDFEFFETPSFVEVYIDFNQNGIFEADTELVLNSATNDLSVSGFITIPPDAQLGSTRMRVIAKESALGPCSLGGLSGEVEDYCLNIILTEECLPPGLIISITEEDEAVVTWISNSSTNHNTIRYRPLNTSEWFVEATNANFRIIDDLFPCTEYELNIFSICSGDTSQFSETHFFSTKGCGACLDFSYCEIEPGHSTFEWIQSVSLNAIDNNSGANNGYQLFDDITTALQKNNSYTISLLPGFANVEFNEYFKVWIDYNQNGIFEEPEEVAFDAGVASSTPQLGMITIPENAQVGATRMRVSMKYEISPEFPCEGDFDGEIEEYCVNIVEEKGMACTPPSNIFPFNDIDGNIIFDWEMIEDAVVYQIRYRESGSNTPWIIQVTDMNSIVLSDLISCVFYEFQLRTICTNGMSNYSSN